MDMETEGVLGLGRFLLYIQLAILVSGLQTPVAVR